MPASQPFEDGNDDDELTPEAIRVLRDEIAQQLQEIDRDPSRLVPLEVAFERLRARRRARSSQRE